MLVAMKVWPSAHPTVLQRTVGPELLKTVSEVRRIVYELYPVNDTEGSAQIVNWTNEQ